MLFMILRVDRTAGAGNPGDVKGGNRLGRKMFHQAVFLRFRFKGKKLVFQFRQRRVFSLDGGADLSGRRHFLAHMLLHHMFLTHMFLASMFFGSRKRRRSSAVSGFSLLRGCGEGTILALLSVRRKGRKASLHVRGSRG